jgi:hypothetical protein
LQLFHDAHADHGLACATRQYNDAAAATGLAPGVKDLRGLLLILSQNEGLTGMSHWQQMEGEFVAVHVAGQVFGRVAYLHQHVLDVASLRSVYLQRQVVYSLDDEGLHPLVATDLDDEGHIVRDQQQCAVAHDELDPSVA